jgi:hypothetical protein
MASSIQLPDHVRHRGPWQGQQRGELANLSMPYLLDITEQGYALVKCEEAVFRPEEPISECRYCSL